jgi:uncharacterized membrane protein
MHQVEIAVERIEKTFEIDVPVRVAYDQWTQFEEFPRFMEDIHEVKQLDNVHLHWRASIGGKEKEWNAQITEQVPDQVIAWRSLSGTPNTGRVTFQSLGDARSQLTLVLEYEPETAMERVGDLFGIMSRKVDKTVEDFKRYVEERRQATGGWRGEVHGSRSTETGAAAGGFIGSTAGSGGSPGVATEGADARDRSKA